MRKLFLVFSFVVGFSVTGARAGTLMVTVPFTATGTVFLDSEGVPLTNGSILRLGAFINPALSPLELADFVKNTTDFVALNNIFAPLAEMQPGRGTISQMLPPGDTMVVDGLFGGPGSAFGNVINVDSSSFAEGQLLHVWAFDTTDFGNIATANWGIFTSSNPAWRFSANPLSPLDLNTGLVDTASQGMVTLDGLQLAATPEPTAAFFMMIATALAVIPRRRHTARGKP